MGSAPGGNQQPPVADRTGQGRPAAPASPAPAAPRAPLASSGPAPLASSGRTRRSRHTRVVAQPQSLDVRTKLTGSYRQLPRPQDVDEALARGAVTGGTGQNVSGGTGPDPLGQLRAKDEDPAGWGEAREDLAEQMKREKPPHWG